MPLSRARPGDEPQLLRFLAREPYYNLFAIANLAEGLGPHLEMWVQPEGGTLMRRRKNWLVDAGADPAAFDFAAAAAVMDGFAAGQVQSLVGVPAAVDPLYSRLARHRGALCQQLFAVLPGPPAPVTYTGGPRPARLGDLDAVAAIYAGAGAMARPREEVERMLPRTWVLEAGGRITCVAAIHARTDRAAMIGAVFTPPDCRRRGYASTLVHAMSDEITARGRAACLFYHNPEAGRIYLRLGFRELGPWRLARFALP